MAVGRRIVGGAVGRGTVAVGVGVARGAVGVAVATGALRVGAGMVGTTVGLGLGMGVGVEAGRVGTVRGVGVAPCGKCTDEFPGVRVGDGCVRDALPAYGVATGSSTRVAALPSSTMFTRRIGV